MPACIHDGELLTGYQVGGQFGYLVLIDSESGVCRTFDLGASDEDSEAEVSAIMAELTANPTR